MKVRWTDSSLRIRITPSELGELASGLPVGRVLAFPGGSSWRLVVQPGAPATELRSAAGAVELALTSADVGRLQEQDVEGVYFATGGPAGVRYFIEKDFPCAHPHSEETCEPDTERFTPTAAYLARKRELILEAV